eukprot:COSAG04_NODE_611_length_12005_cov_230.632538_10_plen_261_part_00
MIAEVAARKQPTRPRATECESPWVSHSPVRVSSGRRPEPEGPEPEPEPGPGPRGRGARPGARLKPGSQARSSSTSRSQSQSRNRDGVAGSMPWGAVVDLTTLASRVGWWPRARPNDDTRQRARAPRGHWQTPSLESSAFAVERLVGERRADLGFRSGSTHQAEKPASALHGAGRAPAAEEPSSRSRPFGALSPVGADVRSCLATRGGAARSRRAGRGAAAELPAPGAPPAPRPPAAPVTPHGPPDRRPRGERSPSHAARR